MIEWVAGAGIVFAASLVMGLAGFGIGLVGLAFLPWVMAPATAVVLITLYAFLFTVAVLVQLRRDVVPGALGGLLVGSVVGTPAGVWVLAALPASALARLIGAVLIAVVLMEWRGLFPARLAGGAWSVAAGVLAGITGGAVGTPGPPVIVWATSQGWPARTMKANLTAFFVVNQGVITAGYWWAGLFTAEVARLALLYAVPAGLGGLVGVLLFERVDAARFRRLVFGLLLVSGLVLLVRG